MRPIPTASGEPTSQDANRRFHFTLGNLFTFVTAIPVSIGILAAVEFYALNRSYEWFGLGWHSTVRYFLCDSIGIPASFVAEYVSFALLKIPPWICYIAIALVLGLNRSMWASTIVAAFITSIFIHDLIEDYNSGLQGYLNLRLISLFGVAVVALCCAVVRRLRSAPEGPQPTTGRIATCVTYMGLVAALGVSLYGWWLIDVGRKAGVEVREMF